MKPAASGDIARTRIEVTGIVQGVGFRPFIYRLAKRWNLSGYVMNTPSGVTVEAQGLDSHLTELLKSLQTEAPPLARISSVIQIYLPVIDSDSGFSILSSLNGSATTEIAPDGDVCDDCLKELFDPIDRRYLFPFITCTNCGPRYSIITGIPYDRPLTTMAEFPLCNACRDEYENPADRRFHAQPLACHDCGPRLRILDEKGEAIAGDPILLTGKALQAGKIVAIKGLGGYHLAVDALNSDAVLELRRRKRRASKPFATMVLNIEAARRFAEIDPLEARLLESVEKPILLLKKKESCIAPEVAPDSGYLGIMLASTPLHHIILNNLETALVMTSANRSSEPLAYRDDEAVSSLSGIADLFLVHNRKINARMDDSVIRVFRGDPLFIRRSKGYAPRAVRLLQEMSSVIAVGAELKVAFCLTRGSQAFMSQHIGDMQNIETVEAFHDTRELMQSLHKITPELIAHDMHPDYLSTRYATDRSGLPCIPVQHHHAHMASCMAENHLEGDVIGIIFDGTGYGDDGTIWGGEFLTGDYRKFRRSGRLRQMLLPGGEAAINEPFRMAIACCLDSIGVNASNLPLVVWSELSDDGKSLFMQFLEKRINSPLTSSCGRLFDAVAALLGVRGIISYEGQAAIELESVACGGVAGKTYPYDVSEVDGIFEIDWRQMFASILTDIGSSCATSDIALNFHITMAKASLDVCRKIRYYDGLKKVVLSGGVFQNRLLTEHLCDLLLNDKFEVFTHRLVPPNDGGLALGQAVIACRR